MKNLLLSVFALAAASMAGAQTVELSVSNLTPVSTGVIGQEQAIEIDVTNDGTEDIVANSVYYFTVTLDGNGMTHPITGSQWFSSQSIALTAGSTLTFILATNYEFDGEPRSAEMCVSLTNVIDPSANFYTNVSGSLSACNTLDLDWAASVEAPVAPIENIYYANNTLNMNFGLENKGEVELSVMNITGQRVARTVALANGQFQWDVNALRPGLYIVTIKDENGNESAHKFFVN